MKLQAPDASSVERPAWRKRCPVVLPSRTGLVGEQISELLLFSIVTTADMVGLSSGNCCTHRRPTCKHLCNLYMSSGTGCATAESRRSSILCWFQDSQACKRATKLSPFHEQNGGVAAGLVGYECSHVRKERWCGSVPLAAQCLQHDNSEAIDVALQRQAPLHCVLWSSVAPSV